jgi:hypothetical protein
VSELTTEDREILAGRYHVLRTSEPNPYDAYVVAYDNGGEVMEPAKGGTVRVKFFPSIQEAERWIQRRVAQLCDEGHAPWRKK